METIKDRVERIEDEISGVASMYGITSWEKQFLASLKDANSITPKQRRVLNEIEEKVFG